MSAGRLSAINHLTDKVGQNNWIVKKLADGAFIVKVTAMKYNTFIALFIILRVT